LTLRIHCGRPFCRLSKMDRVKFSIAPGEDECLNLDNYSVTIYHSNGNCLTMTSFAWNETRGILEIDIEAESGCYSLGADKDLHSLEWSPSSVHIRPTNGVCLSFVNQSPETMRTFHRGLAKWKKVFIELLREESEKSASRARLWDGLTNPGICFMGIRKCVAESPPEETIFDTTATIRDD